jgi:hypothetical protein
MSEGWPNEKPVRRLRLAQEVFYTIHGEEVNSRGPYSLMLGSALRFVTCEMISGSRMLRFSITQQPNFSAI